ncbi:MAG: hypothetical protein JNM10_19615, partial [Planctomycetia bacterium]|nr:hypothetical protein [Planctomycetia bacterium]
MRLGARWRVHVVDARDGRDLAGAEVDAEVELVAHPRPGGRHAVAASRTTTTGPDGRATLERMPSGRGGAVFVRARGYVLGRAAVEASDAPTRDVEVRMIARLPLPLASAPVDVFADGRPLAPEDATLVVAFDDGAPREARPGERVVVDDDPAGAPTREATVRLLVPGYAGPPQRLSLTRGVRARLETSLPPPREVVVAVLDPTGAPLPGVDVRIAPASVLGAVEARTTWHGVTDASGEVRASAPFASALAVRPRAAGRYFPVADRIVDVDGPSTRVEAVGLALARLTVALADGAAPSELALAWSDVAFAPGVEAAVADGLAGGARATARGALARTLPARVAVDDTAARPVRATLEVLPGTFTLVASAAGATSAPT